MSSSRRTTLAGALSACGLTLAFVGMATVAECFWIAVWLVLSSLVVLAAAWVFFRLLAERDRKSEALLTVLCSALHDLRLPLNQICEKADHLGHGLVGTAEAARAILKAGQSLLRLVETSAEISLNYSGKEETDSVDLDLAFLARDMADIYEAAAEEKDLALACSLPEAPVRFRGHESKLRRLIGNLLDNAVKFTPEGGRISLTLADVPKGVRLEVSDTGCGIADDERNLVFERFYRGKAVRQLPGSGMGLAMVHSIVMFYHGEIACDSKFGRGTTFRVFLPR